MTQEERIEKLIFSLRFRSDYPFDMYSAIEGAKIVMSHQWIKTEDEPPTAKTIYAKLDTEFCGGFDDRYEILHWHEGWDLRHPSGYYDEGGENIPTYAITYYIVIPKLNKD